MPEAPVFDPVDLFTTWACRQTAHDLCGGLGFQMKPGNIDLPCQCECHVPAEHLQPAAPEWWTVCRFCHGRGCLLCSHA